MWPLPKYKDQKTYVEVPFGGLDSWIKDLKQEYFNN
jgi:hypothetical protein